MIHKYNCSDMVLQLLQIGGLEKISDFKRSGIFSLLLTSFFVEQIFMQLIDTSWQSINNSYYSLYEIIETENQPLNIYTGYTLPMFLLLKFILQFSNLGPFFVSKLDIKFQCYDKIPAKLIFYDHAEFLSMNSLQRRNPFFLGIIEGTLSTLIMFPTLFIYFKLLDKYRVNNQIPKKRISSQFFKLTLFYLVKPIIFRSAVTLMDQMMDLDMLFILDVGIFSPIRQIFFDILNLGFRLLMSTILDPLANGFFLSFLVLLFSAIIFLPPKYFYDTTTTPNFVKNTIKGINQDKRIAHKTSNKPRGSISSSTRANSLCAIGTAILTGITFFALKSQQDKASFGCSLESSIDSCSSW